MYWRRVGTFYRKGYHLQSYVTVNAPHEYTALKMHPPWDKWIVPKPVLISKLVLDDFEKIMTLGISSHTIEKESSQIPSQRIILHHSKWIGNTLTCPSCTQQRAT